MMDRRLAELEAGLDFDDPEVFPSAQYCGTGDYTDMLDGLGELSLIDISQPGEHGDFCDPDSSQGEFDVGLAIGSDDEDAESLEWAMEEGDEYWISGENEDSDVDSDGYVPISSLLANDDYSRQEWYSSPEDRDFRAAVACFGQRKSIARTYLLEMLSSPEQEGDGTVELPAQPEAKPGNEELLRALNNLMIPGLARQNVERICDILIKYPNLNLRDYLKSVEVFTLAYVIWGVDYYMNKKLVHVLNEEILDQRNNNQITVNSRLLLKLKEVCKKSLGWFSNNLVNFLKHAVYTN